MCGLPGKDYKLQNRVNTKKKYWNLNSIHEFLKSMIPVKKRR
jgi:hypothetical protein